jgi:hypothetical protein
MSGPNYGIAVLDGWNQSATVGNAFPQLNQQQWGEPRVATSPDGTASVVVAPLQQVAHDPLTDPDLFWSDQIAGRGQDVSDSTALGIHGLRSNYVTVSGAGGDLVAVATETQHGVYLIGFRAATPAAAKDRFDSVIQTFDPR